MCFLNGWHLFESIRFDLVKITMWRCLVLQIWEQQKQLLRKQRVIQLHIHVYYLLFCLQTQAPLQPGVTQQQMTAEREELKCALVAAQDSAVVQILLEGCLPGVEDKVCKYPGVVPVLTEVRIIDSIKIF